MKLFGDIDPGYSRYETAKIVILPVPYDATSTWLKGADKGPEAIIEASANMELYDIEMNHEIYKYGIFTAEAVTAGPSPEDMVQIVYQVIRGHLEKDKFVVTVGGEHSVSIAAIQAHSEKFDGLSILQLDAHSDLRDEYNGSAFNHACVMARAREFAPIVQVGIRSMDITEKPRTEPAKIFFAEKIIHQPSWIKKVVANLTENVYVTIDLDVFDPAVMPSTGTPEPGGLFWYDVLALMKEVCNNRKVVGFDVVELCPNEHNRAPDFLAAKLIYKILGYVGNTQNWQPVEIVEN